LPRFRLSREGKKVKLKGRKEIRGRVRIFIGWNTLAVTKKQERRARGKASLKKGYGLKKKE